MLYWGHKGGGSQYAINVAEELSRIAEVYVTITDKNQHIERFKKFEKKFLVRGFRSKFEAIKFALTLPYYVFKLLSLIRQNDIDAIYVPMTQVFSGLVNFFLKTFTGVKVVFTMHDAGTHNEANHLIKELLLKIDTKNADAIVFVSKYVKEQVREKYFGTKPYRVAPFGRLNEIDHSIVTRNLSDVPNILFFGRIEAYKGLDLFVDALLLLSQTDLDFTYTIAGSGLIQPDIIDKIKHLSMQRSGRLLNGWVSDDDLDQFHKNADLLVVPYKEASQSGVLATAQDYCLPFVCTPAGALPEQALGNGGEVTSDFDHVSLSDSILRILNRATYNKKVKEIIDMQSKLSWAPTADAIIELVNDLVIAKQCKKR